jgi:hypothetical protein
MTRYEELMDWLKYGDEMNRDLRLLALKLIEKYVPKDCQEYDENEDEDEET